MVSKRIIPYGRQCIEDDDIQAVVEALKGEMLTTGEKVDEFEKKVAAYCGAKYAVAVSSGTAALHCAYYAVGVREGDEVITTPITFFATASTARLCGGTVVLADVREDNINIDYNKILSLIGKKTKVIVPVDFAGHPAELDKINALAHEVGLVVIEDACHALGAEYKGKKVGSWSDMTVFSFHPVKSITSFEGGMIVTDSEEYYEKMRQFRSHNIIRGENHWEYEIKALGFNYRLSDVQCALGISQMNKLDRFISRRREIAQKYNRAFSKVEGLILPVELDGSKSSYHLYPIQLKKADRDKFIRSLLARNIKAQVHYIPLHYFAYSLGYRWGAFPVAEKYYGRTVSLPIFPQMTDEEVDYVIGSVKRSLNG